MSKAGAKIIEGLKEVLAVTKGEKRMMCWSCGSAVRPPEWRCDCTKLNTGTQRIVPVPDDM